MDINKNDLRKQFTKQWKKHYNVQILKDHGFHRQQCKKCKRWFWAPEDRDFCADASCIGYQFIGDSPCKKKLEYVEAWKKIEKYFVKHKHTSLKPYPTVARWRDDLYFTVASINDFQPYVVSGELPPPANPLIVPQPCIRFPDISNVGVSGRHYTNFVMIGQHAFNTKKKKRSYWKNEALGHDIKFMKELGIPIKELVFIEDVWAGGGNFGPCIEYFVRGLELGNCVFMQYEVVGGKTRELETKVIDMGAGLERFPWITQGTATSYDISFRKTLELMKKMTGINVDEKTHIEYAKLSGRLDADEVDIEIEKGKIEKKLGEEFINELKPMQALYATADHTLTLLFTSTDGMLPSNAGGGYNLRMILRRVFGFEEEFGLKLDFGKIIESLAKEREKIFPHLKNGVPTTIDVIDEEKKKYKETREKAKGKVANLMKKGRVEKEDFVLLYKSHGVPPEAILEEAKKQNVNARMPSRFYEGIQESEGEKEEKTEAIDVKGHPKTKVLYYIGKGKFKAKVLGILKDKYLVLDQTAFYPESGGQAADSGTIDHEKVGEVIGEKGVILHEVSNPKKFRKGMRVEGMIDIERRITITRHHTAAHLLNAACRKILGPHVWQGGSHKDEEKAHLDLTHYKKITDEELKKIEIRVNEYIMKNLPIKTEILSRNKAEKKYGFTLYQGGAVPGKELRVVKIGKVDAEACGGTHHMLKNTGEIGCFKIIKRESVQDGIERIEYKCGDVAIEYMQEKEKLLKDASSVVSVSEEDLPKTIIRFFEEWKKQKKDIDRLKSNTAEAEAERIIVGGKELNIVDYDEGTLKLVIQKIAGKSGKPIAIVNKEGIIMCGCNASSTKGANELLNEVIKEHGGSGGGSKQLAFGKLKKLPKIT